MRDRDSRLRNSVREPERDAVYVVDRVVQEEHLTSAPQLLLYSLGDDEVVVLHDEGLDREPVPRRLVEDRHIADAAHSHVQRARDRRRGKGQHVDVPRYLL